MKQGPLILAIAVLTLSIGVGSARAATRTVTSLSDSGGGTLRDTLAAAAAGDTIQFSVTGQIKLNSSLTITKNVTISGPGQAQLSVTRASDNFTLFVIRTGLTVSISGISITNGQGDESAAGGIQNAANLTLTNCILSGNVGGDFGSGGAIDNAGALTVNSCAFDNNKADNGGGAISTTGSATVTSCIFSGNSVAAGDFGGAILNYGAGQLTVDSCTFLSNSASDGGAIMNFWAPPSYFPTMDVRNSTFKNNNASYNGGAIFSVLGTTTLTNCSFSGNTAQGHGGAIGNDDGKLTMRNCTVADNSAATGGGVYSESEGGGSTARATLSNCTLSNNSAPNGGGIYNDGLASGSNTSVTLDNTILFSTNSTPGSNLINAGSGASITSQGYNLSSDDAGGYLHSQGDQINTDPKLGSLQDNGGPTQTIPLLPGSPAWDKGKSFNVTTDERGVPRPVDIPSISNASGGNGSDIGAVEMDAIQTGPAFVVTTTDDHDDGACSFADCALREAINAANATSGATVSFKSQVTGVITLQATLGGLTVSNSVTVVGPGARTLAVSGNSAVRVFNFTSGTSVISGLTIQDGLAAGATAQAGMGGGIANSASLTVNDCMFTENSATGGNSLSQGSPGGKGQGGAIYSAGILTLNRCTFSENTATGGNTGTAITKGPGGNGGAGQGGAVFNEATHSLTISSCSFLGNIARGGHGGNGSTGGNGGAGNGGAICNAGQMTTTACTISSNAGANSSGGTGPGGNGLAGPASGGIANISGGTAIVSDSISANNTANGGAGADVDGAFTSGGYNLLGTADHSTGFTATGDIKGTDASVLNAGVLGPPSNYGGPTDTFNLTSNSPAIDAGKSFGLPTDQRGLARIRDNPSIANAPGGDGSDIGAIEFGGAVATPTPTPTPGLVGNVSTRLPVGTGDNVLIEGFIVQGPAGSTKKIIVRAIGPSLTPFGITDALANPTLEIHDADNGNAIVATNDDWRATQPGGLITTDQSAEIAASGFAPRNDLESAIIANLTPGSYTAVVRGVGNGVGTGVVDAYDLSSTSLAKLANIATRGLIQPGDKLMIAGFIVQNAPVQAVVRAIGPSLSAFGITNALADTTLQLRDGSGAIVVENDDWKVRTNGSSQQAELEATGLQPTNDLEAAFVTTLQPGQYTAQVRGKPETTGIGVVQVYFLQ